ncbi:unnamed protein product [Chrysoparadoxa australica]
MIREQSAIWGAISSYFKIEERGSTIGTEIRAGVAAFLTMSYNLLVNPQLMSQAGVPAQDVVVATAAASACASLAVGILGNLPFGMAPGMGLSAYLVFGLVLSGNITRVQALTSCLISGALLLLVTLTGVSKLLMSLTPHHIKLAIVVGMGLLVSLIGMVQVDLVVSSGDASLVALGDLTDWKIWLVLAGLLLIGSLTHHQVKGGILIGIFASTITYWGVTGDWPERFVKYPELQDTLQDNIDFCTLDRHCILPIVAFLFVALFDVSGVMFGLGALGRLQKEDGTIPGGTWGFLGSGAGTILAAMGGCSPIIVQVENAAGIREGGRTGLTAVVVGLLFTSALFLAPLFGEIPSCATAPVLILVGAMMTNESKNIDWTNMKEALPAFLCLAMMPFTYSIPNGILFGLTFSFAFFITSGEIFEFLRPGERTNRRPSFIDSEPTLHHPTLVVSSAEAASIPDHLPSYGAVAQTGTTV